MKKLLLTSLGLAAILFAAQAQQKPGPAPALQAGDVAFVGYNGDGNDNLSFVTFVDIPANTTIYFNDNEWTILSNAFNTGEATFTWTSNAIVKAGTVVNIDDINTVDVAASVGTIAFEDATNKGISGGDETIYMYVGSTATPQFISAIASGGFNSTNGEIPTELTLGTTALSLVGIDDDADIAAFTGNRVGDLATIKTSIYANSNWTAQDGTGDQSIDKNTPDAPFALTPFGTDIYAPELTSASATATNKFTLTFNEKLDTVTVKNLNNYSVQPTLNISALQYDSLAKTIVLTTDANLSEGVNYTVLVGNLKDKFGNAMLMDGRSDLFFNTYKGSDLVISEINYNPSVDSLEFIEIYNKGNNAINIGGLKLASGVLAQFPEFSLQSKGFYLVAFDAARASSFYGKTFAEWSNDNLSNGGEALLITNSLGDTLDFVNYDDVAPWPTSPDGTGPSLELKDVNANNNDATNWTAAYKGTSKVVGALTILATPGVLYTAPATPTVSFSSAYVKVNETTSKATMTLSLSSVPAVDASFMLRVIPISTADSVNDVNIGFNKMVTFKANGATTQTLDITINNDNVKEADEYIGFEIVGPLSNVNIDKTKRFFTAYIVDNDNVAPTASKSIELNHIASYDFLNRTGLGVAEIVTYDSISKRLVTMSTGMKKIDIIDFSNPASPVNYKQLDVAAYGGGITSVAINKGILAVGIPAVVETDSGSVLFFDMEGVLLKQVKVGFLPDMITFTPDSKWLLTANEGQPKSDYTIDPEGSVSMIDISNGIANLTQANVYGVSFAGFNAQEAQLLAAGVRKAVAKTGNSSTVTLAQDLEPEFITVSKDSKKAWVTLQENNAVAVINLETKTAEAIVPLGFKDVSKAENAMCVSDQVALGAFIGQWPVKTWYMPDAIANYTVGNDTYLVTANEGDEREYTAVNERSRIDQIKLDSVTFPYRDYMRQNHNFGRLRISNLFGDIDNDNDFDELYAGGARSFAIWNATTGALVFESGSLIERITAVDPQTSSIFNSNHEANAVNGRSLAKGPEPEGVTIGMVDGKPYAFITLERIGGVMAFDISNPAEPVYTDYKNTRKLGTFGGDNGPEGVLFIKPTQSPDGKSYVVSANEVSGTLTIFEVKTPALTSVNENVTNNSIELYPNPASNNVNVVIKNISQTTSKIELINFAGQVVKTIANDDLVAGVNYLSINTSDVQNGIYFVKYTNNESTITKKLLINK